MSIRPDVAELLHAGLSDRAIARQLHTDHRKVSAARASLGLSRVKSGVRPATTPAELYHGRTVPLDGGHVRWTGHVTNAGVPVVRHGGRMLSAYRIAFQICTGREAVGYVRPACGMTQCVAPSHLDDQPARNRANATFDALFGGTT